MKRYASDRGGLWLLAALLAAFLLWASLSQIEQTVRAQGQLIASARTQIIQAADGGVLKRLYVREGQAVRAGDVLAEFELERAQAGVAEHQAKLAAQQATLARLAAEANRSAPQFEAGLRHHYPQFVAAQLALYRQRQQALAVEEHSLGSSLQLARDELAINRRLAQSGDVATVEVMRAERQVIELQGRLQSVQDKFRADARSDYARIQEEQAATGFRLDERQSILQHTQLTAPMAGIVKSVRINTEGGVLRQGDELMQIAPADAEQLVEVNINPADVGQLHTGLPVHLRFDAFDSAIYGRLQGELVYLSPDTLSEQSGAQGRPQVFYRAHVRLLPATAQAGVRLSPAALKPGMSATVDIHTGSRSLLSYLLKPINKSFTGALNER